MQLHVQGDVQYYNFIFHPTNHILCKKKELGFTARKDLQSFCGCSRSLEMATCKNLRLELSPLTKVCKTRFVKSHSPQHQQDYRGTCPPCHRSDGSASDIELVCPGFGKFNLILLLE